jgi:uncharacterized cupin superfamily protein
LMGFKPEPGHIHFVENQSQREARFLMVCSKPAQDSVHYEATHSVTTS